VGLGHVAAALVPDYRGATGIGRRRFEERDTDPDPLFV